MRYKLNFKGVIYSLYPPEMEHVQQKIIMFQTQHYNWEHLLKTHDLSASAQKFLANMYFTLFQGFLVSSIGVYVDMQMKISGMMTSVLLVGTLLYLSSMPGRNTGDLQKKLPVFLGFCFLKGMSISSLVDVALRVD